VGSSNPLCFWREADERERDGGDRGLIALRLGDHNRLGFAVQLCTARYLADWMVEQSGFELSAPMLRTCCFHVLSYCPTLSARKSYHQLMSPMSGSWFKSALFQHPSLAFPDIEENLQ
jgi:hypothetical protein